MAESSRSEEWERSYRQKSWQTEQPDRSHFAAVLNVVAMAGQRHVISGTTQVDHQPTISSIMTAPQARQVSTRTPQHANVSLELQYLYAQLFHPKD